MGLILVIVQVIALALTEPVRRAGYQAFENPEAVSNSVVYIGIILLFTIFTLLIIKMKKKWIIHAFILFTVFATMGYVFYAIFSFLPITKNLALTLALAGGLTILLNKFPEWYIIDITGIIIAGGASAIFGISLAIIPVLVLLIALSIYDALAVYKTRHMIALAEGVMDLRLPVLFVIPKHWRYSFRKEKFDKEEREAFFMGLGDAVMPTILVVSAKRFLTQADYLSFPIIGAINAPALGAVLGTLAGFAVLMIFVIKGKPQAGLPLLNSGAILGFFLGLLLGA